MKKTIQDLMNFKDDLDDIVKTYFDENEYYSDIIRNGFSKFIITNNTKPAQLLAKYIDSKLTAKDISEDELDQVFNKAMILFRFIQGRS